MLEASSCSFLSFSPSPIGVLHPSGQIGEEKDRTESWSEILGKISRVLLLSMKSFHYSDHLTFFGLGDPHPIPSHRTRQHRPRPPLITSSSSFLSFFRTPPRMSLCMVSPSFISEESSEKERERTRRKKSTKLDFSSTNEAARARGGFARFVFVLRRDWGHRDSELRLLI